MDFENLLEDYRQAVLAASYYWADVKNMPDDMTARDMDSLQDYAVEATDKELKLRNQIIHRYEETRQLSLNLIHRR